MRKSKIMLAVSLLIAILLIVSACAKDDKNTAKPTQQVGNRTPGISSTPGNSGDIIASPYTTDNMDTSSPETTDSPDSSSTPGDSSEPDRSTPPEDGSISGFTQGGIVKQEDVPEIVSAIRTVFADREIQSIVYDRYDGKQAYKVTLQGEGELARNIFVLGDGTIILPAMGN